MRVLFLLIMLSFVFSAGADPVFPPMVGGEFQFHVQPSNELDAEGVPLYPLTASIGIIPEGGGTVVACVDTPDQQIDYYITASVSATGVRQPFKAFAYSQPGCTGDVSTASENTGYTYPGMSPQPADLF